MRRNFATLSLLATVAGWTTVLSLVACGGEGGGIDRLTTRQVSGAVASATTVTQMQAAFQQVFTLLGFSNEDESRELMLRLAQAQLDSRPATFETLEQAYNRFNADLRAEASTEYLALNLTAQEFVDMVNPRLPNAYLTPDTPSHAAYMMMSAPPGQIPVSAPTMRTTDRLSLFQVLMMADVRTQIWIEMNDLTTLPAKEVPQASPVGRGPCQDACNEAHSNCSQGCSQAYESGLQDLADWELKQREVTYQEYNRAVQIANETYNSMAPYCQGNSQCLADLHRDTERSKARAEARREHRMATVREAYFQKLNHLVTTRDQCKQQCDSALQSCLDACHNQGGG